MSVRRKLTAFMAGLVVAFGAGYGVGDAIDPVLDDQPEETPASRAEHDEGHQP